MAAEYIDEMSDDEFYNIHEYVDPNPETCGCISCKRYLLYKKEKDEFKARVYANVPQTSDRITKEPCVENCVCPYCQTNRRYRQCKDNGHNSLCYKIKRNISLDDCNCNAIIHDKEVENYMESVTSHGKNLPIDYMADEMNRFQIYLPETLDKKEFENNASIENTESDGKYNHIPLPLPVFTAKFYDTEENRNNFDVYHMNAKAYGLSARSAFKLLQIDEKYGILKGAKKVVDLCAAPGGWSKVLSTRLFFGESDILQYSNWVRKYEENETSFKRDDVKILAIDLMDMLPIPGVIKVVGDISKIETANTVINEFKGELADVVVCDGAADVSISLPMGDFMHRMVVFAALHITCNVLKPKGTFVMKVFYCDALLNWVKMVEQLFDSVDVFKPDSSRHTSPECFLVCQSYNPPLGFDPTLLTQFTSPDCKYDYNHLTGVNREIIPILVSDDFSFKEKHKNYLPFEEVYERHHRMFKNVEKRPQWKIEMAELKKKENISKDEFDVEFNAILQRISERKKEDERLAKEVREKILCELKKRGNKRSLLEVSKFSKGRSKEMQRRNDWAREDALLCPEDTKNLDQGWEQHVVNVIRPINRYKTIRNDECDRLRAAGAHEEEIIQRRVELYAEHQRKRFLETNVEDWVKVREGKGGKKNNKQEKTEVLASLAEKVEEMKLLA